MNMGYQIECMGLIVESGFWTQKEANARLKELRANLKVVKA